MPRGPGKATNYNLDYSRFNGVKPDEEKEEQEETPYPSELPPLEDVLRNAPPELRAAYHLQVQGRANGDKKAEQRANELVLEAMKKASPEVQRDFIQEMARRAPEAAGAIAEAVSGVPAKPASVDPGDLAGTIDVLRREMETGAQAAKEQMDGLRRQQDQLESLRTPEDFMRFMQQEGGMTEQDLQRIFGGDQQHLERCMTGLLDKATGEAGKQTAKSEQALKAAEDLHSSLLGKEALQPLSAAGQPAEEEGPAAPRPERPKPKEEEVLIPVHRLQYEKDEESRYTAVKLRCTLPGVSDMSAIMLDISEKHIRLSTCSPAPRYAVNAGPFPVLIDPSAARAKYSKRKSELSVEVPAKVDR